MDSIDEKKIAVLLEAVLVYRGVMGELLRCKVSELPLVIPHMQHVYDLVDSAAFAKILGNDPFDAISIRVFDGKILSREEIAILRGVKMN